MYLISIHAMTTGPAGQLAGLQPDLVTEECLGQCRQSGQVNRRKGRACEPLIQEPEGAGWETSHCGRLAGRTYTTHRSTVLRSPIVGDWRGWWRPARGQKCPGNRRIHSQSGLERVFVPIRLKLHTLRHLSTYWKIHPHFSSPNSWLYAEGRTYRPMTHLLHAN